MRKVFAAAGLPPGLGGPIAECHRGSHLAGGVRVSGLELVLIFAAWWGLQAFVLPKLGVPT